MKIIKLMAKSVKEWLSPEKEVINETWEVYELEQG